MTSARELAERLLDIAENDDHARGCQGLEYSCTCGYDVRTMKTAEEAADFLESLSHPVPGAVSDAMVERLREHLRKDLYLAEALHDEAGTVKIRGLIGELSALPARVAEASGEAGGLVPSNDELAKTLRTTAAIFRDDGSTIWAVHLEEAARRLASPQGDKALRDAARAVVEARFSTYTARNGREVGVQDSSGEQCWIVPFDEMAELEAALSPSPDKPVSEPVVHVSPKEMAHIMQGHVASVGPKSYERTVPLYAASGGAAYAAGVKALTRYTWDKDEYGFVNMVPFPTGKYVLFSDVEALGDIEPASGGGELTELRSALPASRPVAEEEQLWIDNASLRAEVERLTIERDDARKEAAHFSTRWISETRALEAAEARLAAAPDTQGMGDVGVRSAIRELRALLASYSDSGNHPNTVIVRKALVEAITSVSRLLTSTDKLADPDTQGMVLAWQPMDSAPKDGTRLLLTFENRFEVGYWSDMQHQWVDGINGCQFADETPLAWGWPARPSTAEQGEK